MLSFEVLSHQYPNSSFSPFDSIGLGSFDNPYRDGPIEKVRNLIKKGLKLMTDNQGNIYASKLTSGDVIVKGYMDPSQHCMAGEVVEHMGRLTEKPMKVRLGTACLGTEKCVKVRPGTVCLGTEKPMKVRLGTVCLGTGKLVYYMLGKQRNLYKTGHYVWGTEKPV